MSKHGATDTTTRQDHGRAKRRLLKALGLAVVPMAAVSLMATPASATQKCNTGVSNVCLTIVRVDSLHYRVTLGLDYRSVTLQQAQAMLNTPVSGQLIGSDFTFDDTRVTFKNTIKRTGASADSGFSVEWSAIVGRSPLNEDDMVGDRGDEIYGRVQVYVPHQRRTVKFETPQIKAEF